MDHHQQELRRAAARAFAESLDQLKETLQPVDHQLGQETIQTEDSQHQPEVNSDSQFDLTSFEQAVADIERFITAKEPSEHG